MSHSRYSVTPGARSQSCVEMYSSDAQRKIRNAAEKVR